MQANIGGPSQIQAAVVIGQHAFDVPAFYRLFRSMPDVDFYVQDLENLVADHGHIRDQYDVLLFYNFHRETPGSDGKLWVQLETLGEVEQGILVLHHGLLAFPQWPVWSDICGIRDRSFDYYPEQTVRIRVTDRQHPITRGVVPWEMVDETYTMEEPGEGSEILLTTNHPKSMRSIAWTRQ